MLCLPLKPITKCDLVSVDCTSPKSVAEALWNNMDIDGTTKCFASICVAGSIALEPIHDLACDMFADGMIDTEIEIDESGYDDGMTWLELIITGEINDEGRAEAAEAAELSADPYGYYGVKRSDFI